ncbi:uncharacterized protein [Arachis hypogaea]|uniref:uncharacterized protein isoform X3 n=1 Tax=Arachis hypogaea TaxID=3818 RepID=UPI003B21DBD7
MTNKLQGEPKDAQRSNKGERGVFRSIKVYPLEPNDKRLNYEPPTDLLSKLSLVSEVKKPAKLPSKLKLKLKHGGSAANMVSTAPVSFSASFPPINFFQDFCQRARLVIPAIGFSIGFKWIDSTLGVYT